MLNRLRNYNIHIICITTKLFYLLKELADNVLCLNKAQFQFFNGM